MPGAVAWNSCSSGPDKHWRESQWQAHRNRVEIIQSAKSVSAQAFSNALAASAHPHRIHSSSPMKLTARLKSPAVKARQKQIDRENLILIKKIIALDNAKTSNRTKKKRRQRQSKASEDTRSRNAIVVPQAAHSNHECLHPVRDVQQHSAASHVLYMRSSATMKNNYVEYNAPTMFHSSNTTSAAARVRSRVQSKIHGENKIILQRILSARTTIDRSDLERHEERHNKLRAILSRHHSTHLAQQPKRRPRSASQASSKNRMAASCPLPLYTARTSTNNESLVLRMRKMTIETQSDDM
ncbi:Hypothetical protein PHPALM_9745 [Phytophthora palmivora]|uniref:Uncharacterized protein n=1 Tax=Phytophthora palmivora TaxID=4796 RepID=A0A2P4Y6H8_9STRA|nr:Hypothetical protein PHPALM_9745 [Phytophthora palmivora]